MRVVPKNLSEKISWGASHVGPWTENAASIGSTPEAIAAFAAKVDAARIAKLEATQARAAAQAATLKLKLAAQELSAAAASIVLQVRTKAETTRDRGVYTLAQISPPATPAPIAPPGTPESFEVVLRQDGAVDLTWKCKNPRGSTGVMYELWRRNAMTGERTFLGVTGEKRFRDDAIPAGVSALIYEVQAKRSTAAGPWATFNVTFGAVFGRMPVVQTKESRLVGRVAA